jgi:hypothetical protein
MQLVTKMNTPDDLVTWSSQWFVSPRTKKEQITLYKKCSWRHEHWQIQIHQYIERILAIPQRCRDTEKY